MRYHTISINYTIAVVFAERLHGHGPAMAWALWHTAAGTVIRLQARRSTG